MSRIGNRELLIPEGVTVTIEKDSVAVKGPKGELSVAVHNLIKVEEKEGKILTKRINESKQAKQSHGTTNSLIENMLIGVTEGFIKELEAIGVGYRFAVAGKKITVNAGYSHPREVEVPEGLTVDSASNTELSIKGIDKKKVSDLAAFIRKIRPPEPYKGKGIRYKGEYVRRKEGKKAA